MTKAPAKRLLVSTVLFLAITMTVFWISFAGFASYGASSCNRYTITDGQGNVIEEGKCECFCCQGFGVQGYESCGIIGAVLGLFLGASVAVILLTTVLWRRI
jgi:hypothetical protein